MGLKAHAPSVKDGMGFSPLIHRAMKLCDEWRRGTVGCGGRKIQTAEDGFWSTLVAKGISIPRGYAMRFLRCCFRTNEASFLSLMMLLLAGAWTQPKMAAQDTQLAAPAPPPPPAVFEKAIPSGQLAFLNAYAGRMEKDVRKDKQFHNVLKLVTPKTAYFYGHDMDIWETIDDVLDVDPLPVSIRDGRYAMVATSGGGLHGGRGFVWFDMQAGIGLGGIYFRPTNGEPTPTLAIYSRQLKDRALSMGQLPLEFAQDLSQWEMVSGMPQVTIRYFIPDNGKKYALLHDEDYCDHPANAPAPPQDECQQLNAEAADKDMDAAYFMQQTGNRSDATAYMLGADQVAWIGVRNQTCGGVLACQIRLTRRRTRVLIGGVIRN